MFCVQLLYVICDVLCTVVICNLWCFVLKKHPEEWESLECVDLYDMNIFWTLLELRYDV